jgi:hypothetical protein
MGDNQVVELTSPPLQPKHRAAVLDALARHWVESTGADGVTRLVDHAAVALLGGYGAGKTTLACIIFLLMCLRNWRTSKYGGDRPRALVMAPTSPILHDTAIHRLEAICPPALIAQRVKSPWALTLINGLTIQGKSADGALEGTECCVAYFEEIQHENYWRDPLLWPNYVARVRDPHAHVRRIIVAGLPAAGSVRAHFDRPGVLLHQLASRDNPAIDAATMNAIRQACPMGQEEALLNGAWMQPPGALFPQFNVAVHCAGEANFDARLPVHLALDVGTHSAAIWFQVHERPLVGITGHAQQGPTVHVLDDLITYGKSVADIMLAAKTRQYQLSRGSVVCMDPTVRADERNVVQSHFPACQLVQLTREDPYYFVDEGIRLMQMALGDSLGNVRLTIASNLQRTRNGVVAALQEARRDQRTAVVVKDDRTDHARDALRYATCWALGGRGGVTVLRK